MSNINRNSALQGTVSGSLQNRNRLTWSRSAGDNRGEATAPSIWSNALCTILISSWSALQGLLFSISMGVCILPLYLKICLSQAGLVKPCLKQPVDNRVYRTVGIVINRCTLLRVVIFVDQRITDPRILRAIAIYSILRSESARYLPRYVKLSMRRELRAMPYIMLPSDIVSVTMPVRVELFEHFFYLYGIRQAALEMTVSDNLPEYHSLRDKVLRLAAWTILTGLLCLFLAVCFMRISPQVQNVVALDSTKLSVDINTLRAKPGIYNCAISSAVCGIFGAGHCNGKVKDDDLSETCTESDPEPILVTLRSTDPEYVKTRLDEVLSCANGVKQELSDAPKEELESLWSLVEESMGQYLEQMVSVSKDGSGRETVLTEESKKDLLALALTGSALHDTLIGKDQELEMIKGRDQRTSSVPSGASKYGPNGKHPWNGFIGKGKKAGAKNGKGNKKGTKAPQSDSGSASDKPQGSQEADDPYVDMLKDRKKSVSYLLGLRKKAKERKKPGALSLPDPKKAEYHTIEHVPEKCAMCPMRESCKSLKKASSCGTYYNIRPVIIIHVDKHVAKAPSCPMCGEKLYGMLPDGRASGKGYDDTVIANAIYTCMCGNASRRHTADILSAFYGMNMGRKSSIDNWIRRLANNLREERIDEGIKNSILAAYVINLDETGQSVNGKLWWVHAVRAPLFMYYHIHKSRGYEGISAEDWIEWYEGYATHDFWKAYYKLPGVQEHILCCIHLLRELFGIVSFMEEDFKWAANMMTLLISAKTLRDEYVDAGSEMPSETVETILELYDEYVKEGLSIHPEKKGKCRALLNRLRDYKEDYLRWLTDPRLPFTNNDIERSLRPLVIHEKTSGAFRSEEMSADWMLCMSFIGTCKLHDINPVDAITAALKHKSAELLFPEGIPGIPENCLKRKAAIEEKRLQEKADAEKKQQKSGKGKSRKKKASGATCKQGKSAEGKNQQDESVEVKQQQEESAEVKNQQEESAEVKHQQEESAADSIKMSTETSASDKTGNASLDEAELKDSSSQSDVQFDGDGRKMQECGTSDSGTVCTAGDPEPMRDDGKMSASSDIPAQKASSDSEKKPKHTHKLQFMKNPLEKAQKRLKKNGDEGSDSDQAGDDQSSNPSPEKEKKPLTKTEIVARRRKKLEDMIVEGIDFQAESVRLKGKEEKQKGDAAPPPEVACSA